MNVTVSPDGARATERLGNNFLIEWCIYNLSALHQTSFDQIKELLCVMVILALSIFVIYNLSGWNAYANGKKGSLDIGQQYTRRVLFLTAHPSDECLYFGPTIMRLKNEGCQLYLICLTLGNYTDIRRMKTEVYTSCDILGIPQSNITLKRFTSLPTHQDAMWNSSYLAAILNEYIEIYDIHDVYTFDHVGINGDPNHCSIFYACARLCLKNRLHPDVAVFFLESVNFYRKWSFISDTYLSLSSYNHQWIADIFITFWEESNTIQKACMAYSSKFSWKRQIHVLFSRYIYVNTYRQMQKEDLHLVLQMTNYQNYM